MGRGLSDLDGDELHQLVYPSAGDHGGSRGVGIRVQAIMEDQGVWEIVEPPDGTSDKEQASTMAGKHTKVRSHLLRCLPYDLLMQVAKKKSGKEVWDSLKARFVGADRVKEAWLQTLKSEFDAL